MENNHINGIESYAIAMAVSEEVVMTENTFKGEELLAFYNIKVTDQHWLTNEEGLLFKFIGNTMSLRVGGGFLVLDSGFELVLERLILSNTETCEQIEVFQEDAFYTEHGKEIYVLLENANALQTLDYVVNEVCSESDWLYLTLASLIIGFGLIGIVVKSIALCRNYKLYREKQRLKAATQQSEESVFPDRSNRHDFVPQENSQPIPQSIAQPVPQPITTQPNPRSPMPAMKLPTVYATSFEDNPIKKRSWF